MEFSSLSVIDVENQTAFHLDGALTPNKKTREKRKIALIDHYIAVIVNCLQKMTFLSAYITVDNYFMKKEFVNAMLEQGLNVITKMRVDGNLKYLFKGKSKSGKGRSKKYDGKVDLRNPDRRRWEFVYENKNFYCISAILYSVSLKRNVRIVHCRNKEKGTYEVFLSTDLELDPRKIETYYRLRFQIEFLFRDGKQHAGMSNCQARDVQKINFHINMALTNLGLAKATYYLSIPKEERGPFSVEAIKRAHYNHFIVDYIFSNLQLDLTSKKIHELYENCIRIGNLAA